MAYLGENVIHFQPKVLPFLGYFFNEPTKSSLIGEKIAQSGHLGGHRKVFQSQMFDEPEKDAETNALAYFDEEKQFDVTDTW